MNSQEHNRGFLLAGGLAALFLAAIVVFALRADVPRDAAVTATILDVALQIAFGACCWWAAHLALKARSLPGFVDHGTPSLKALAAIAPWLVILQIGMGAALRYKLMGAISHVGGAMLVGAFLLYYATGVMAPAPAGHPTRQASLTLLWIVVLQVLLGIAAYVVRFGKGSDNILPDTRLFTIAHIFTGALTLACTYVLGEMIRKSSTRQEAQGLPSTPTV
jgi:hypothetical protein